MTERDWPHVVCSTRTHRAGSWNRSLTSRESCAHHPRKQRRAPWRPHSSLICAPRSASAPCYATRYAQGGCTVFASTTTTSYGVQWDLCCSSRGQVAAAMMRAVHSSRTPALQPPRVEDGYYSTRLRQFVQEGQQLPRQAAGLGPSSESCDAMFQMW